MNTSDKTLIEKLTQSKVYREYEAAFRCAVGLPLAFTATETWGLPLYDDSKEGPFCHLMAQTNKSCAACLQLQAGLRIEAVESAATATCFAGLSESVVPVRLGDRLIGFLHTGQVFTRAPSEAAFQQVLATLVSWGVTANAGDLRDAFFATRVVAPRQYEASLSLLRVFAEQLASLSNQILVADDTAENSQITRAREFIEKNLTEDIHLADGARIAHMSASYFCKSLKRAIGLSFTEYLSRLRTERAKARLLDPHVRMSEVAFEVGFQSLSQFNRIFKRVTGQCPSDFRLTLAANRSDSERLPALAAIPARRFAFSTVAREARPNGKPVGRGEAVG